MKTGKMARRAAKLAATLLSSLLLVGSLTACGEGGNDKDEAAEIEVSAKRLNLEVGDEEIIEVENYDDLKKLDFEVEDEDIIDVEETDDGEYTVTALAEGTTNVIFSAKDAEDVSVKVRVSGGSSSSEPTTTEPSTAATGGAIELSTNELELGLYGDEIVTITNYDSSWQNVTVTSSDSDIAEEYDGYGTELPDICITVWGEEGTATITVSADGMEPATITVTAVNSGGGDSWYGLESGGTLQESYADKTWDLFMLEGFEFSASASDGTGYEFVNSSDSNEMYWIYGNMPWDIYCFMGVEGYTQADNEDFDYTGYSFDQQDTGYTAPDYSSTLYRGERISPQDEYGETDMYYIFWEYEDEEYGGTDFVVVELQPDTWAKWVDDYSGDEDSAAYWIASYIFNY